MDASFRSPLLLAGFCARIGAVLLLVVAIAATLVPARLNVAPAVTLADPSVYPQRSERLARVISVSRTRRQTHAQRRLQLSLFTHKAALLGGLVLVLGHGAGSWCVDRLLERRRDKERPSVKDKRGPVASGGMHA